MKSQVDYGRVIQMSAEGWSNRKIARSVGCSRDTVARILQGAEAHGVSPWEARSLNNMQLEERLFPQKGKRGEHAQPDFAHIHKELAKKGVNLQLLHTEYCTQCARDGVIPYGRSQFNKLYRDYVHRTNATMRITHKPAEILEVDWAGDKMYVADPSSGIVTPASLFVACLPASQFCYAEAFPNEKSENWITAHVHAFKYIGGVPRTLVPDNLKTGIDSHPSATQFRVNQAYQDLADYYGAVVIPTGVYAPKHKASVERSVGIAETWIIAALRNEQFQSFDELNQAVWKKLAQLNSKPFEKRTGSRAECFEADEKPFLLPLPDEPYDIPVWTNCTVPADYLVSAGGCQYSVPHEYIGRRVSIRTTRDTVEVFCNHLRIVSEPRRPQGSAPVYRPEHMPAKHRKAHELSDPQTLISRASEVGAATEKVMRSFFASDIPEKQKTLFARQLLKLGDRYSVKRLEAACAIAMEGAAVAEPEFIEKILKNSRDKAELTMRATPRGSARGITRGSKYYGR